MDHSTSSAAFAGCCTAGTNDCASFAGGAVANTAAILAIDRCASRAAAAGGCAVWSDCGATLPSGTVSDGVAVGALDDGTASAALAGGGAVGTDRRAAFADRAMRDRCTVRSGPLVAFGRGKSAGVAFETARMFES